MRSVLFLTLSAIHTLAVATAIAAPVGPDSHGYTGTDSTEVDGPTYSWDEIADPGNLVVGVTETDDGEAVQALSFLFPFYGVNYDEVSISSNGAVFFSGTNFAYQNNCLPSTGTTTPFIAPYWDDLNPSETSGGGEVYAAELGSAPDRFLVVQWQEIFRYGTEEPQTFQAVLRETGEIEFRYATLTNPGDSATIGSQKDAATALEYSCDAGTLSDQLVITLACSDDLDGDGSNCTLDCDDNDPSVHPGALELCDGIDSNCDGDIDQLVDADADGAPCPVDCDDNDDSVFPGNLEVCDGADQDCDGLADNQDLDVGSSDRNEDTQSSAPALVIDGSSILTSDVEISASGVVADVDLTIDISHSYVADLTITLIGPDGTAVVVSQAQGGSDDDFTATTFDDQANGSLTDAAGPFSGSFVPLQPLSAFNLRQAEGTWTLQVEDSYPGLDDGTLNSWTLTVDAFLPDDSDGDGWVDSCGDCDATEATVYPDAPEICDDGLDNDCDEATDLDDPDCDDFVPPTNDDDESETEGGDGSDTDENGSDGEGAEGEDSADDAVDDDGTEAEDGDDASAEEAPVQPTTSELLSCSGGCQLSTGGQPVDAGVMALGVLLLGGLLRRRRQAAGTVL